MQAGRPALIKKDGKRCSLPSYSIGHSQIFCGRRPLPFGGSHLRLPSGPAGIRTTTGSLSALARPTPYQLSHRVAPIDHSQRLKRGAPDAFTQAITRITQDKQNHPVIAQMIRPGISDDPPPTERTASSSGGYSHRGALARTPAQPQTHFQ